MPPTSFFTTPSFLSTALARSKLTSPTFTPNSVPGYVRWDAMVSYEQPKYTLKFNVQNLFDRVYYDALYDNGGFTVPGQARGFILSGEYKF